MRRCFRSLTLGRVASCWSVFERTKHVIIAGARQDVPSPRKFRCRRMSIVWTAVGGQALFCRNSTPFVTIPYRVVRIRGLNLPRCISPNTHGLLLCSCLGSGQELVLVSTGELSTSLVVVMAAFSAHFWLVVWDVYITYCGVCSILAGFQPSLPNI